MPTKTPFCPRCSTPVSGGDGCSNCGLGFKLVGSVVDVIADREREERARGVEEFYSKSPFPGYAPGDDAAVLLDRCRRSAFLTALDAAVPADARVLDCGCGTAQIPAFLALSGPRREVIGIDGCRASLTHADGFRERVGISNLQLVRGDLFDLPVPKGTFQFVNSRGVVHHTPDPDGAIARVAECVAPGGILLLGFYETRGRLFHCFRRALSKVVGKPLRSLDPILRMKDLDDEKKRIWIEDQYLHPLEHILPLPHVLKLLKSLGFRWVRTVPPATARGNLFEPTAEPGAAGISALRWGWAMAGINDPDAGLICLIARKQE